MSFCVTPGFLYLLGRKETPHICPLIIDPYGSSTYLSLGSHIRTYSSRRQELKPLVAAPSMFSGERHMIRWYSRVSHDRYSRTSGRK